MGKRSTSRRLAMQAIYQAEISGNNIDQAIANLLAAEKFIDETKEYAQQLAQAAWQARGGSDQTIAKLAVDWPLDRIGKVDHAILRLALYEIDSKETPPSVVVNEAVELAKKYSGQEAAKFINGILGTYLRSSR
jgi:N utilization substance protein B